MTVPDERTNPVRTNLVRVAEDAFRIGATKFTAAPFARFASTPENFCVVKPPELIERYVELVDALQPRRIVELGICRGGSTALLAALARPDAMLAVELAEERIAALDTFLVREGLSDFVVAAFGIDQSDGPRLEQLVDETVGPAPLDLVVDDASHDVELTRLSFNVLFPRLRPGGLFVIEDWAWAHAGYEATRPGAIPLTQLVFETVLTVPYKPGLIDDVVINREWAVVRRGERPLEPGPFDISGTYGERGRSLFSEFARGT